MQRPSEALALLMKSKIFQGFSDSELIGMLPGLQPTFHTYSKDSILINEGDPADKIAFVARGRVVAKKITSSGRIHILAMHEAGDDFGFDAAFSSYRTSPLTFTADTDCTALFISTVSFFDRSNSAADRIIHNANRILADKCVRLLYKTDVLSKQSLRDRIITYFNIMEKKNQSASFVLKMSREQFAQYLCVNRSALSRELSRMQSEGLIELRADGHVLIRYG